MVFFLRTGFENVIKSNKEETGNKLIPGLASGLIRACVLLSKTASTDEQTSMVYLIIALHPRFHCFFFFILFPFFFVNGNGVKFSWLASRDRGLFENVRLFEHIYIYRLELSKILKFDSCILEGKKYLFDLILIYLNRNRVEIFSKK